jgi:hypothetical protein
MSLGHFVGLGIVFVDVLLHEELPTNKVASLYCLDPCGFDWVAKSNTPNPSDLLEMATLKDRLEWYIS